MARRRQVQIRIEDIREAHEQWHSRSSKAA
jgi:hypothetical protein